MSRFPFSTSAAVSRGAALFGLLAAMAVGPISAKEPADGRKNIRVLLTYGGHKFEEQPFFAMWDALPGIEYAKAPLPDSADRLKPGLEKQYDVIVMYDMNKKITPEQQKGFLELLQTGIGLVSLHHNLGAYDDWDEFHRIIGGRYVHKPMDIDGREYAKSTFAHGQDLTVTIADKEHPITRGLNDFTIHDEAYGGFWVSPGARVLLRTSHPKNSPEVAWTQQHAKGRVFYLMLGHDSKAWANPAFPEILARGIRWAAGRQE